MNKEQAKQILNRTKSTKQELREALAWCLGETIEQIKASTQRTVHQLCRNFFQKEYNEHTKLEYYWQAKDASALKQLLNKIEKLIKSESGIEKKNTFEYIIKNLPNWYRDNAFSLTVINSKFNEIIASIKSSRQSRSGITRDYAQRVVEDLLS